MFKNYGKLFVMLLALGVAGQVFGGPTTTLVKQKKLEPKNFVECDELKQDTDTLRKKKNSLQPKVVVKQNLRKSLRKDVLKNNLIKNVKSQQVPSVKLAKDGDGNVYVLLQKILTKQNLKLSNPAYALPTVLKDSKDVDINFVNYVTFDNDSCIWVKVGSYCNGCLTLANQTSYAQSFKDQAVAKILTEFLKDKQYDILTHYATPDILAKEQPEPQSFLDSTLGKTIVYGGAAAVTALVGWWWFSRAK